jgi:predicted RNase H-like HicB family nuclease
MASTCWEVPVSTYAAVITHLDNSYRAVFPDFSDLTATGATVEDARTRARLVLEERLAAIPMEELPSEPRSLDGVLADATGAALVVELSAAPPKRPAVRINITIPEDLLQAVDRAADGHAMSRSRFLAKAVEAVVTGRRHQGIQIPIDDQTLVAVDRAAEAHQMNRVPFLTSLITSALADGAHSS